MAVVAVPVEHKEWRLTRLREFIYLSALEKLQASAG